MEVRSESGVMQARETFSMGMQKAPVTSPPVPAAMPNMRLTCTPDGTQVYKPISTISSPPYQGVNGGGSTSSGVGGVLNSATANTTVAATGIANATANTTAAATATGTATINSASFSGDVHLPAMPPQLNVIAGEPVKRKRGRPRKYGPDGSMNVALTPVSPALAGAQPGSAVFSLTSPSGTGNTRIGSGSSSTMKKAKGRPPGSGRKQQLDALGSGGIGFTPHVITVKTGEDVLSKIMSFSQHGPRAVCIISANGAISNVTLRQAATSGGTVTYEGRFEILSLSGSFMLSETSGQRSRTGGLSLSLAGPDGRVLGGGVAGLLTAASPVQVVVGSFIADGRKDPKPMSLPDSAPTPIKLAPIGMAGAASPPSRGTVSESSGGPGSPLNQSTGACNNSNQLSMSNIPWKF